ncbi:MAG: hypothetical protein CMP29_07415 [Roseibacillus sp.]|nr:hypothetical protein [Roseibacillus sp.]
MSSPAILGLGKGRDVCHRLVDPIHHHSTHHAVGEHAFLPLVLHTADIVGGCPPVGSGPSGQHTDKINSPAFSSPAPASTAFLAVALGTHVGESFNGSGAIDAPPCVGHQAKFIISCTAPPAPSTLKGNVSSLCILRGKILKKLGKKLSPQDRVVLFAHLFDGRSHVLRRDRPTGGILREEFLHAPFAVGRAADGAHGAI